MSREFLVNRGGNRLGERYLFHGNSVKDSNEPEDHDSYE